MTTHLPPSQASNASVDVTTAVSPSFLDVQLGSADVVAARIWTA
jgi:hypothetical protein